jgi:homoserine dehydrogenase
MSGDIIVLKFGGSVLRSQADVPTAVHEIYRWYRAGWRVVAIASALGDSTARLLREARELASDPQPHAMAELLASGERQAAALLGIALDRVGIPARVIDPREVGLTVSGTILDGDTTAVQVERLQALLEFIPILVLAGFGYGTDGRLRTLGPGGSDHSAVYLAHALRANRCRLLKDVDGVYEADPALASSATLQRFSALGYADALELATTLIQPKAVRLLDHYSARAEVAAIASPYESVIGRFGRTPANPASNTPTRVLILGLGEIGLGIHRRAVAMHEHFNVIGALVRDRGKHVDADTPLFDSLHQVMNLHPDVVVDALPDLEPSHSLAGHFLERGISVVSCNTALIAELGRTLSTLAARCNAYLRYSAAVGGSAPMLETLRRESHQGDIRSIAAVFGGVASHILEGWVGGRSFEELSLSAATETDAARLHEELSGTSASRKLRILARHAFGRDPDAWHVVPLDAESLQRARDASTGNCTLRWIARAWTISHRVFGQLQLEALDIHDPLAQGPAEWDRLLITRSNGQDLVIQGRGGGRWPTVEALMADLLDVRFAHLALARIPAAAPSSSS